MLIATISAALTLAAPPALEPFDKACRAAPTSPYERSWKWLELPIKCICLSDDDGGREVHITAEEIQRGLVFANAAYARARIRFAFDPKRDLLRVHSTLLNGTEAGDKKANDFAQELAGRFPGYATLFFRWGAGRGATGGCYSGFAGKTVLMCQYWESPPPVPQNVWLIGHEVGHYLGLGHTFGPSFATVAEAEKYFIEHKDDPACFDGDGLADTAPEPCIGELAEKVSERSISLDGKTLALDRENLMNYTGSLYKTVSRSQAVRMRWSVENKLHRWGSSLPSNEPSAEAWRLLDLVAVHKVDSQPFPTLEPYANGIMRGGGRVTCYAHAGSEITYETPKTEAGVYQATLFAFMNSDLGAVRISIDGKPVGSPIDLWDPVDYVPTGPLPLGKVRLAAGTHRLTVTVVGKNAESSNFHWSIEAVDLTPAK